MSTPPPSAPASRGTVLGVVVGAILAFAALLFGFSRNLGNVLSTIGSTVPSEFLLMLPYAVTVFAVAGFVGRVRAPAAENIPYIK